MTATSQFCYVRIYVFSQSNIYQTDIKEVRHSCRLSTNTLEEYRVRQRILISLNIFLKIYYVSTGCHFQETPNVTR